MITLDKFVKKYKAYEVDFVLPKPSGDRPIYLDLYLLYESPEVRWHKVQAIVYEYFNHYLKLYKAKRITGDELTTNLHFPEVPWIALGHCKKGIEGRGTAGERAEIIKRFIFDDPKVLQIGMDAIAKLSVEVENIGPDVMSDMVANFGMHQLLEYTQEQVKIFDLKTTEFQVARVLDLDTLKWKPRLKVQLPYFEATGEPRIFVPRHLVRRLPLFSTAGFFDKFLRHILREAEQGRAESMKTIGKKPRISFKQVAEELKRQYGSVGDATRKIAKQNPDYVINYLKNPYIFQSAKRRKVKEKINWDRYIAELKKISPGKPAARQYAEYLRKIFTALYDGRLINGTLEEKSEGGMFFYDINFSNGANTPLFHIIRNQQIKAGVVIIEAKNYGASKLGNKEFNQSRAYTLANGRELVILATRKDVTDGDIQKARRHFLAQRCIILPISDSDIMNLIDARRDDKDFFDELLIERLQKILTA
jgi:hypothetical protein